MNKKENTLLAFCLITSLFFLWGFAHNLDPILIPHLKKSFTLTTTQAMLVDSPSNPTVLAMADVIIYAKKALRILFFTVFYWKILSGSSYTLGITTFDIEM
jgi:hypothetical protein